MVTEALLSAVFVLGAPLWLAVEELLHRMPDRAKAEAAPERQPSHEAAPAARVPRTA